MATEKRNRWIINVILILAVIAFVGFSMIPLLDSAFKQEAQPQGASSPSPSQSASPTAANQSSRKETLESQAKGYELVLQREPENQTALKGLLESRLELIGMGSGKVEDVIPPLEKLVKLNPNEADYAVLLAQAQQQSGDREASAQTYRDILTKKPGNLNALNGLVSLLIDEKRPEAAAGLLQDTLKKAPQENQIQAGSIDVPSVQLLLGRVYAEQKRYDEALAIYDEAAQANKNDFRPIFAKAVILKAQGKTEEAKPLFTSAANLAPANYKDKINQLANETTSISPTPSVAIPSPAPAAP